MVMACKAESETEEAKDKVRARLAVTTEVVDAFKRAEQPDHKAHGCPEKS